MDMWNAPMVQSRQLQIDGKHGPGRPKMTWKQLTERDSGAAAASFARTSPHLIWNAN